ncbi:carbon-nitrogen hydrolase [Cystobasidium minutum MCA 4210]|uniref:carbon-nitrogen hydrolase n=1 Tax=Cystobasidium minutum MCA 4210 TaxID=1397322 RepID=UPI0034CF9BED|eukprot:jgi/Rhomi1/167267/fgenesh1_kg.2_\
MPSLVAAVVQCGSVYNDTPATIAKMRSLAKKCKQDNERVQLVVFPEAFIGGYPKFSTFGVRVGARSDSGRQEYVQYHKNSISTSGDEMKQIEAIARELEIFIVSGFIEKEGGTLYCSVGFVDPKKGLVYSRRKLMPTAGERLIWGFGTESDTKVVKASFDVSPSTTSSPKDASNTTVSANGANGNDANVTAKEEITLSSAICWENMMPLFRSHYYQQGTQIHCIPTVDGRDNWEVVCRMIAMEGRCFVLNACQFSQQKDFPNDHPVEQDGVRDPEAIMIRGGSCIVSPMGEVLAGPLRGEEGILTAELDLDLIIAGKFDLDVVGHYSRPDLFKLISPAAKQAKMG